MRWWDDILNLIYPPECHLCGNSLTSHERFICTSCEAALPRTGYHRLPGNPMEDRFAGQFPFKGATGHFFYSRDSSLSQLIQDMKYRNFPTIGERLGEIAGHELFTSGFLSDVEMIVPLPMYFLKKTLRGYNQTDMISRGISKATGIPVVNALRMVRHRKTQTSLGRIDRLQNADGLFEANKKIEISGKGLLLVDDICTTGATMTGAAKALHSAYDNVRLYLFTLGVTF